MFNACTEDLPINLEYISAGVSPETRNLSVFTVSLQSPKLPRTPKTERAFEALKTAVEKFEQEYATRKLKAAGSTEWDDDLIAKVLQRGTQGNVFEASIAFGKSIAATLTKREKALEQETGKPSISGFVMKLFPLLKVLLSIGEAAAQV